jgi:RNA polymerase sigma-70 factor (ECF subfamily)
LDRVEDVLAEAFVRAAERWPNEGVPANPSGWLYTTAYRNLVGRLRAEAVAGRKAHLRAVRPGTEAGNEPSDMADDRLHLILLCCHPALPAESRSALALRLVVGTPTDQIARLFLVSTSTMAARLTRAKKKIVVAGIPLGAPFADELASRLDEVCRTVYLAFTAGYAPSSGPDAVRMDLAPTDYGHALEAPETVFYLPTVFSGDPASGQDYSATGIRGDATLATTAKGQAALDASVQDLISGLQRLFPEATGA